MKITKIRICNFRSIKNQTIDSIGSSLILIGKNNAGKSAVINALRVFFGDLALSEQDFRIGADEITIEITFSISDHYLVKFAGDSKLGLSKIPSNVGEFESVKIDTNWKENTFSQFKVQRDTILGQEVEFDEPNEQYQNLYDLWEKAFIERHIEKDKEIRISLTVEKNILKNHYTVKDKEEKDIINLFPKIAFVDDDRNFVEEENGKARSLTNRLFFSTFTNAIQETSEEEDMSCSHCQNQNCEEQCINIILGKDINILSIPEIEKLLNYKTKCALSCDIDLISDYFQDNYRSDYKISIDPKTSIDKAFSLSTKLYDPILKTNIDLSNVGAGLRSIYVLSLLQAFQDRMTSSTIFLVEEPELYLHPELQKKMAKTLYGISEQSQIVFSTHSPIMLSQFETNNIRKVSISYNEYETQITKTNLDDVLEEIGYATQDIILKDFVLIVEGKDDVEAYKAIIERFYEIDFSKICIIDAKSCLSIGTYATLRFLNNTTFKDSYAVIRDSDTMEYDDAEAKINNQMCENIGKDSVSNLSDHIYITKYSSVEGLLINPKYFISNKLFKSHEAMKKSITSRLEDDREKHIHYFKEQNKKKTARITDFEAKYDEMAKSPMENIEWLKHNLRGHNLFGYFNATKLSFQDIVNATEPSVFQDFIGFLDKHKYFEERKRTETQ